MTQHQPTFAEMNEVAWARHAADRRRAAAFPPATSAGDPTTSFEAEGEVNRSGHRKRHIEIVLNTVCRRPGLTARELGRITGLGHIETQRRLSDLKNASRVVQGAPVQTTSGRRMVTWWAA